MPVSNTGILTYNSGAYNLILNYNAPSSTIGSTGSLLGTLYCALAKVEEWPVEEVPPAPEQTQYYIKNFFKNMFAAKKIGTSDMSPVIERINWTTGTVYAHYDDRANMFALNEDGSLVKKFYVKNRFDQVFKCLWNNNGGSSTVEPVFEPGTFNANQIFQGADDYKWKYIYTISAGVKIKFMDESWMPVPIGNTVPNPVATTAGIGSIDVINVINGGTGYDEANAPISVVITGDGSSASANVTVTSGSISDVVVANTGSNYSYANVSIVTALGSGANVIASISPIGGHAYNPLSELGSRNIMLTATFDKNESGNIPTDIDYRQLGILVNPFTYFGVNYGLANAVVYKTTTDFIVSAGFGAFTPDETVYQSTDGLITNSTFTATVLSFDSTFNTVKLINTFGTALDDTVLYGATSGTTRVVLQQQTPSFIKNSGYLIYLVNRTAVQRNADGSEQFKLVLGY